MLAEEILEPLGFRWNNYGVAEADLDAVGNRLHHRPAAAATGLDPAHPRPRRFGRRGRRGLERPAVPDGDRPGRERRHQRQRALALLRDHAPRRRARRRARARARDDPHGSDRAVAPRDGPFARLPDALQLRPDARRAAREPLRPRHAARLRPSRLHQHARLGRSASAGRRRRSSPAASRRSTPRSAASWGCRSGSRARHRSSTARAGRSSAAGARARPRSSRPPSGGWGGTARARSARPP